MLKRLVVIFIMGTAAILLAACSDIQWRTGGGNTVNGSGNFRSESRALSDFNEVSLGTIGDVTISRGDTDSLTIEADDNLLPLITTVVQNSELAINSKANVQLRPSGPVRFIITLRDLQVVTLGGNDSLTVNVNGTAAISTPRKCRSTARQCRSKRFTTPRTFAPPAAAT